MTGMETLDWLARYLLMLGIPYFLVFLAWEIRVLHQAGRFPRAKGYEWRDSLTSMTMGLFKLVALTVCALYTVPVFAWVYGHRVFTLSPLLWWTWVLLFFADDFTYYWYHRLAHRVRLLWCEHVNHHSSEHFNFSAGLRQSTLAPFYIFVYWLPLAWIGFHPAAIAVQAAFSLLYQFWIHTETIGRLGWFEQVFNTPSHHRVHHGSNGIYIDRNYAGVLIIWDRLFGTFQAERTDVPVKYGLVTNLRTFRLHTVIFHELVHMLREAFKAQRWRNRLGWIFGPPEWSPTGPKLPPDHPSMLARRGAA